MMNFDQICSYQPTYGSDGEKELVYGSCRSQLIRNIPRSTAFIQVLNSRGSWSWISIEVTVYDEEKETPLVLKFREKHIINMVEKLVSSWIRAMKMRHEFQSSLVFMIINRKSFLFIFISIAYHLVR